MIDDEVINDLMNGGCLIAHLHNDLDASSFDLKLREQSVNHQFIHSSNSVNFPENL